MIKTLQNVHGAVLTTCEIEIVAFHDDWQHRPAWKCTYYWQIGEMLPESQRNSGNGAVQCVVSSRAGLLSGVQHAHLSAWHRYAKRGVNADLLVSFCRFLSLPASFCCCLLSFYRYLLSSFTALFLSSCLSFAASFCPLAFSRCLRLSVRFLSFFMCSHCTLLSYVPAEMSENGNNDKNENR